MRVRAKAHEHLRIIPGRTHYEWRSGLGPASERVEGFNRRANRQRRTIARACATPRRVIET